MPNVKRNESEDGYVSRCIPIVMHEGTADDVQQAAAICHSMFRESKKAESQGILLNQFDLIRLAKKSIFIGEEDEEEFNPSTVEKAWRAAQTDEGKYKTFRMGADAFGDGISAVYGIYTKDGKRTSEVQSIVFDDKKFTKAEAIAWLKEHEKKTGIEATGEAAEKDISQAFGVDRQADIPVMAGHYVEPDKVDIPTRSPDLMAPENVELPNSLRSRDFGVSQSPDLNKVEVPKKKLWGFDEVELPEKMKPRKYGDVPLDDDIKLKQP